MDRVKAELIVLSNVIFYEDIRTLGILNADWFSEDMRHVVMILKKDTRNFSRVNFEMAYKSLPDAARRVEAVYGSVDVLFSIYDATYKVSDAVKLLETKYIQFKIAQELDQVKAIIYNEEPSKIILRLNEFFAKIPTGQNKVRKVSQNLKEVNETLIWLSKHRPLIQKTIPARKNLLVIGGDSGMHKTNQAIDFLLDSIKANLCIDENPALMDLVKSQKLVEKPDWKAALFEKEMDWEETRDRVIAKAFKIPFADVTMRKGLFDLGRINEGLKGEYSWIDNNLCIIGPEDFNTEADIIRFITENKIDIWALDYVQLFAQSNPNAGTKEMNPLVMQTIAFAKICVQLTNTYGILVSQVRKKDERRLTHFPRLDDLEWSGVIKHLAHVVAMCFWPHRIDTNKPSDVYILSYQKVRKQDMYSEFLKVDAPIGNFTPMPESQSKNYLKYLDM